MKDLALFVMIKEGSPEAVRLLDKNANWKDLRISDVKFKQTQWTLLHLASWYGHSELCKELILLGADTSAKDSVFFTQHQETPLHLAIFRGHLPTIKILVKYTMEKNPVNIVNIRQKGQTPLDLAKLNRNSEIITLVEEWTAHGPLHRGTTINIVEIN